MEAHLVLSMIARYTISETSFVLPLANCMLPWLLGEGTKTDMLFSIRRECHPAVAPTHAKDETPACNPSRTGPMPQPLQRLLLAAPMRACGCLRSTWVTKLQRRSSSARLPMAVQVCVGFCVPCLLQLCACHSTA